MGQKGFTRKENQRRYDLHRRIRNNGGVICTKERTVYVPIEQTDLPSPNNRAREEIWLLHSNYHFYGN